MKIELTLSICGLIAAFNCVAEYKVTEFLFDPMPVYNDSGEYLKDLPVSELSQDPTFAKVERGMIKLSTTSNESVWVDEMDVTTTNPAESSLDVCNKPIAGKPQDSVSYGIYGADSDC